MSKNRYFSEWSELTEVPWWNAGRKQLNAVIRLVNDWVLDDCPVEDAPRLLKVIDKGLQTFAATDGGDGWADELREMRTHIQSRVGP